MTQNSFWIVYTRLLWVESLDSHQVNALPWEISTPFALFYLPYSVVSSFLYNAQDRPNQYIPKLIIIRSTNDHTYNWWHLSDLHKNTNNRKHKLAINWTGKSLIRTKKLLSFLFTTETLFLLESDCSQSKQTFSYLRFRRLCWLACWKLSSWIF